MMTTTATVLTTALLITGCAGDDQAPAEPPASPTVAPPTDTLNGTPTGAPTDEPTGEPTGEPNEAAAAPGPVEPADAEVIATGLDVPWDLAFLPEGDGLVSERVSGRVLRVESGGELTEIGVVDGVSAAGEGGLHGVAVAGDALYAYYTAADDNRVVRMPFDGDSLGDQEVVVDGIPKARIHNGGRIAFGPDGMLYIATGDASDPPRAQDPGSLAGKILRVTPDGDVPEDNPDVGSPVFSSGHRNVQGLAFDGDGRLWATEFGPDCCDGLHLIEPGGNHGWPDVVTGRFQVEWDTADASPSGVAYVRDTIFVAALRGQRLWQVPIADGDAADPQAFFVGEYGRLRHAEAAPDGSLWILTNNTDGRNPDGPGPDDDRILRVTLD